jgi:hypothetical protein
MGHQRSYSWEGTAADVAMLEKGEQNPSQISRDHHVTRSLLYDGRAALSRARGSGITANPSVSSVHQKWIGHTLRKNTLLTWSDCVANRPSNEGLLRSEVDVLKKAWHEVWRLAPIRRVTRPN